MGCVDSSAGAARERSRQCRARGAAGGDRQGVRDQLVEKRRERKWFGEMNMRAFRAFLLSNRTLRMLGMCMGIVGLVDGVIQFSYSRYGVEIGRASCRERV